MNINMNSNYDKMHIDLLSICEEQGVRIMPGKRAAYEIMTGSQNPGLKDFFILPEDMEKFDSTCLRNLQDSGYTVTKVKIKAGAAYKIYREDILATSLLSLMNDPDGKHCPQFIVRELSAKDDKLSFTSNKVTYTFDLKMVDELTKIPYMDGYVYAKTDILSYIESIYGQQTEADKKFSNYAMFNVNCSSVEFIREAKRRGYLSEERIERYKSHRVWRRDNRSAVEDKYRSYQEILLDLNNRT